MRLFKNLTKFGKANFVIGVANANLFVKHENLGHLNTTTVTTFQAALRSFMINFLIP